MIEGDPTGTAGNGAYDGEAETGIKARVKGAAQKAAHAAQGVTDYFRSHDVQTMRADLEQRVREHPVASVAIGFGVGFLLAKLLRR